MCLKTQKCSFQRIWSKNSLSLPIHLIVLMRLLKPSGVLKHPGCEDLVVQIRAGKIETEFTGMNTGSLHLGRGEIQVPHDNCLEFVVHKEIVCTVGVGI